MFGIFRKVWKNVTENVFPILELETKDGKTSMDLVDECNTEGMIQVLQEEREEYVRSCEKKKQHITQWT